MVTTLKELIPAVHKKGKKRLVAAYANDSHTIAAVKNAVEKGIVDAILVGNEPVIREVCRREGIDPGLFSIVHEETDTACVEKAVELINAGQADILMKGLVSTDKYMKGILSREKGLVSAKAVLSHVAVMEVPAYHKLLFVTDVAIIPAPDIEQKTAMTRYVIDVAKALGVEIPKVALIAPSEQVLPKLPQSVDAAVIAKMGDRGQFGEAVIDGPLAFDVAIDKETAAIKKLSSPVDADADCLVFPNIDSANVFFKTLTKWCGASMAGIVVGAKVPCVLTSRGDSEESKLYSIVLAVLSAK